MPDLSKYWNINGLCLSEGIDCFGFDDDFVDARLRGTTIWCGRTTEIDLFKRKIEELKLGFLSDLRSCDFNLLSDMQLELIFILPQGTK
jgi:hypothetical protein